MKRLGAWVRGFISRIAFMFKPKAQYSKPDGYINGHPYVEMCGVKWACYNVGASSPTEYGSYRQWGEISPAPGGDYTASNCRLYGKDVSKIGGDQRYDVARAKWGIGWRLPTSEEQKRLVNQCKWEVKTISGTAGMLFTDSSTGKSIFLPFAGCRDVSNIIFAGSRGFFWASTPYWNTDHACRLRVYSSGHSDWDGYDYRLYGFSVRPVAD